MTQEIVEAIREIEREKGIEHGTLEDALRDALLAAYKKTPGAARHAIVDLDDRGDFRVYSIEIPSDLEEALLEDARERAIDELERQEVENGERSHVLIQDDDLDLDWSQVPEEQIERPPKILYLANGPVVITRACPLLKIMGSRPLRIDQQR